MKENIRKISVCILVGLLTILQPMHAYAATTWKVTYYKAITIPLKNDTDTITHFGGMCITGTTAYCFKTASGDTASRLYKITKIDDYPTMSIVKTWNSSRLGHANGLAYYSNHLYVATFKGVSEIQVAKINPSSGEIVTEYKSSRRIYTIAHFKGSNFIVDEGNVTINGKIHRKFSVATFNDSSKTVSYGNCFYILVDSYYNNGFVHFQDIEYDGGQFYLPIWNGTEKHKNIVLEIGLGSSVVNGKVYPIEYKNVINGAEGTKFEIEAMACDKYGDAYFSIDRKNKKLNAIYWCDMTFKMIPMSRTY